MKSMLRQRTPPIEAGQFHCAVESSAADVWPSRDVSGHGGSTTCERRINVEPVSSSKL